MSRQRISCRESAWGQGLNTIEKSSWGVTGFLQGLREQAMLVWRGGLRKSKQGHWGSTAGWGALGWRVQSRGLGPALAKGRNGLGLGSETWTVIELERAGSGRKGSVLPSVSGASSLHHVWTPQLQGVAWVGRGGNWAFLALQEVAGSRAYWKQTLDSPSCWEQLADEFSLDPGERGCPASNQGPTWAPYSPSWTEGGSWVKLLKV